MKILQPTLIALTLCAGAAGHLASAEVEPAIRPPVFQNANTLAEDSFASPQPKSTRRAIKTSVSQANTLLAQASSGVDPFYVASEAAHALGEIRLDAFGGSRPRTLVIRTGEASQKSLSSLEEDLNVMSRILAKAIKDKAVEEDTVTAMGMKIKALSFSSQSGIQNLYLEGYGALFLFHSRFPLLPPPETPQKEASKEPADSTWEEAKRELYGPKEPPFTGKLWKPDQQREQYDANKVAKLKDALVEALRNATNIRNLKPDEFVTVVVTGPGTDVIKRSVKVVRPQNESMHSGDIVAFHTPDRWGSSTDGETVLTIRAKKADVDAFGKGDLDLNGFKQKVSISSY